MKNIIYLLVFILSLTITSCTESEENITDTIDYITFGHFYGFCAGDTCVQTYQLTQTQLFEDTIGDYSGENLNFIALDNQKYELVKDLIATFPSELLDHDETSIGCPDCSDGGGLFIQYSKNGEVKSWRIDLFKVNVPEYLHDFMDEVQEKISLINEDN